MKKVLFLLTLIISYSCAAMTKIPLETNTPELTYLGQKLYYEEVLIDTKVETLYNIVEFYCYQGLVVVKLPDNKIKYVGDPDTGTNLLCAGFKKWSKDLDEEE